MDTITLNISLPQAMYADIKTAVRSMRFTSVSEFIRDAARKLLYPQLTENGFTREFEDMVLRSEKSDMKNDIVWNGKGSFTDFVLKEGKKKYDSIPSQRKLLPKSKRITSRITRIERDNRSAYQVV